MKKEEHKKRIKILQEEQEGEYEELGGDNGGIDTTDRYWELENINSLILIKSLNK
jgi:hypothetical protein